MKQKSVKKSGFFKKILIKFIRSLGFEMIDQSNLTINDTELNNGSFSRSGKSSITVPLGKTKISRSIKSMCIIIRSYTFGDKEGNQVMLDQNKKRIFEKPKKEYTLRTIKSIIRSCEYAQNNSRDLEFKIIITDDKSNQETLDKIQSLFKNTKISNEILKIDEDEFKNFISKKDTNEKDISENMISNMRNIYKSLKISKNENFDLFYFLEDDYIHEHNAINEIIFSYEKFSSQLNRELFLCPADYPYLYSNIDNTSIYFGHSRHWRRVSETLITFITSKKMILKHYEKLEEMCTTRHHPMEKSLHEIYKDELCLSPIPSLSMHCSNINSLYGIPPNFDWKKVWNENEI